MALLQDPTSRRAAPRQAYPATYLLLGSVFGALWFTVVGGMYVAGLAGQMVLISVPNVLWAQLLLRPIGRWERFLLASLLGQEVTAPAPVRYRRSAASRWSGVVNAVRRAFAVFHDGPSWRVLAWILVRSVTGPLGLLLVALPVLLLLAPLAVMVVGVPIDFAGEHWLLLCPAGLVLLPALRRATWALAAWHGRLAVWALGPGRDEIMAAALARAAQAEEQVRIDQELHDSIGHMLSMIVVQAGAGTHVFDKDPDFARRALGIIEQRGRAALGELDRIITDLRGDHPIDRGGARGYAPPPDGESVLTLIADAREAGMEIEVRIAAGELPAALGRGVYRIVQESLTNAAKHAPGCAVNVDIAGEGEAVAVSVTNALPRTGPAPGRGTGRGLASIKDRATLLGGEATVGSMEEDEFAVRAVLPLSIRLPEGTTTRCALSRGCACLGCTIRRGAFG
ncbi:histidine kinase [Nonomuraea sp. NPDC050786]|uniref:sensor histidine kinase n=1 Tax=Nonomuraea sp. NPDC050786 TaxID=3154840 RepID=UPI0033C0527D